MSNKQKRNEGMPPAEGVLSAVPAAQFAAAIPACEVDDYGNQWFKTEVDLNEVRKSVGDEMMHDFLSTLCGSHTVKIERLAGNKELPSIMGVGSSYQNLRAGAKERGLLNRNTRVSQAPAAFRTLPANGDCTVTDAILTM